MAQALINNLDSTTQFLTKPEIANNISGEFNAVLEKHYKLGKENINDNEQSSLENLTEYINKNLYESAQENVVVSSEESNGTESVDSECLEKVKENDENLLTSVDQQAVMQILDSALISNVLTKENQQSGEVENLSSISEASQNDLSVTLNGNNIESALKTLNTNIDSEKTAVPPVAKKSEGKTVDELVEKDVLKDLEIESIEVELSDNNQNNNDLMQNQSPEEQGVKAMLNTSSDFVEIKTESVAQNVLSKNNGNLQTISLSKTIEQITKQMEGMYNGSRVNIILNPASLGKVSLQLVNTNEGLSAQFTVTTQEARNLLKQGLSDLKNSLISQGVNVDNINIKLNESQESEYNADWTEQEGSRGGYKEQGRSNKDEKEQEKFAEQMLNAQDKNGNV